MSQLTHPREYVAALAGALGDSSAVKQVESLINSEASAEIPFGVMVGNGASEGEALKLATTADALAGIVLRSDAYDIPNELGDTGLKPTVVMSVLTRGRCWVPVEEAVAVGGAVRVRAVVVGAEVAGKFRTTADSTDCIDISAFARWVQGGSSLAMVEIDMLMANAAVAD